MSEKRSRRDIYNYYDDNDASDDEEESARDSLDLDAETERQQRLDMERVQAAWNQRVDMMQQTVASLQNPTVVRAMQMILNLGLVSPTQEFMTVLQMGMRDIEEKERQEEERRRNYRPWEEEGARYRPPSPPIRPPSPSLESRARDRDEFNLNMDALALRSQENYAAGRASFSFGGSNRENVPNPIDDDVADVEEISEEKKAEQARLLAMHQAPRSSSESIFGPLGFRNSQPRDPNPNNDDNNVVDLTGDADNEEKKHEAAQIFSLYQPNPGGLSFGSSPPPSILRRPIEEKKASGSSSFGQPRHPTIMERLNEAKAREEKSPLSQVNVPSALSGASSSAFASDSKQHPLYQDFINADRSLSERIRDYFNLQPERNYADDEDIQEYAERMRRQHNDFEFDEVVPPSPVFDENYGGANNEDEDSSSSSSSSSSDDEDGDNE